MKKFLFDTNIIIDAVSAEIVRCLKYKKFYVSQVVFKEEIIKQTKNINYDDINLINVMEVLMHC